MKPMSAFLLHSDTSNPEIVTETYLAIIDGVWHKFEHTIMTASNGKQCKFSIRPCEILEPQIPDQVSYFMESIHMTGCTEYEYSVPKSEDFHHLLEFEEHYLNTRG
jgi:hypothetical protein